MQNIPKVPDRDRLNSFLFERERWNLQQETVKLETGKDKKCTHIGEEIQMHIGEKFLMHIGEEILMHTGEECGASNLFFP